MQNFVTLALLTRIHMYNKGMHDLLFHTKDFNIIWHSDSVMRSNEQDIQ